MSKETVIQIAIAILTLLVQNRIYGQTKICIQGEVIDARTQKPVEFVNLSLLGMPKGTITGTAGNFKLDVEGKQTVKIVFSHINYQKQVIEVSQSSSAKRLLVQLEPKHELLQNVIVTASLYEQPKSKLVKSAALIHGKQIEDNFSSNIVDALATTPGFTQVWEYHSPIILRGLNSKRLIMMKNGNRRIGTFPGGYFGQDMNIYGIKKVEIIKGPGSVIYGSGAISGIINVISHEPFGRKQTKANFLTGYGSNNNELIKTASLCFKRKNFGIQLNGKYRKTGDYVYGNGETADNSNVEDRDVSMVAGIRLSPKQSIKLNIEYHYGEWGKPRGFNGPTKRFTKVRNEENNLHADIGYNYRPKAFVEKIEVNFYVDNGKRDYYKYKSSEISGDLSSLELVHYKNLYGGGRAHAILKITPKSKLTVGADGYSFRLDNPATVFDYYNETEGSLEGYSEAGQQNIGTFVRNETQLTKKIKLVSGLRYDFSEALEGQNKTTKGRRETRTALSGNLGTVFSLNSHTQFSANVGRAFRMPTAEELFTEVISCKGVKKGYPELQPEYSWNFDIGARGNSADGKLKYDIALFYNILKGFISEIQAIDDDNVDFTFKNTDAVVLGGELSASYRMDHVFRQGNSLFTGLGAAYTYGINKSSATDSPLFGIPPLKMNLDVNYRGLANKRWLSSYWFKVQTVCAAVQNRVAPIPEGTDPGPWGYEPSDSYAALNLFFAFKADALPGNPKLRFIIKNVFDTNYQPFGSYIPAMGRNFKTTLSFMLK